MGIMQITLDLEDGNELLIVPNGGGVEFQQETTREKPEPKKNEVRFDEDVVCFPQKDWALIKKAVDFYFSTTEPLEGE